MTKYFARVPKIEEIEKPKLWINETMEKFDFSHFRCFVE